jgi:chaperonin cofactor prefoldin
MNDRMDRAETAIQKLAEQSVKLVETVQSLADNLGSKIEALADSHKHTDSKLDALTDIVRQWYERHGNGSGGQHPS